MRYAGWSSFAEAGSYGKDTRGIIRVHQFDKVEAFVYCRPEEAEDEHRRLLGWQRQMLAAIEVPYRVIDVAAGDLGASAARKFDCEAWVPTQQTYRELTTSNCTISSGLRRLVPATATRTANRRSRRPSTVPRHHPVAGGDLGEPPATGRHRVPAALAPNALCRDGRAGTVIELDLEDMHVVRLRGGGELRRAPRTGRGRQPISSPWPVPVTPQGDLPVVHPRRRRTSANSRCPMTR